MTTKQTGPVTGRDIILTTPGGSGSTYVCEALSRLANVVALNEPFRLRVYKKGSTEDVCQRLRLLFRQSRQSLTTTGTATQGNGRGNHRPSRFGVQREPFDLVIKQPLTFTALIGRGELSEFDWYALIRNPLLTMCSWVRSGLRAGRDGRAPTAERHDATLTGLLDREASDEDRGVALLNWAFRKYSALP